WNRHPDGLVDGIARKRRHDGLLAVPPILVCRIGRHGRPVVGPGRDRPPCMEKRSLIDGRAARVFFGVARRRLTGLQVRSLGWPSWMETHGSGHDRFRIGSRTGARGSTRRRARPSRPDRGFWTPLVTALTPGS